MGVLTQYEANIGGIDTAITSKIGTESLSTTSKNLSGAINEINSGLANKVSEQDVNNSINTAIEQVIAASY